jgi:outer membrane protein assembly factor BamB
MVEALDIQDCSVKWSWNRNTPTADLPAFFDGTLYVTDQEYPDTEQRELVAIEALTGIEKWRSHVDARLGINVDAGVLLVQGVSELVGVNPYSGAILWRKQTNTYGSFDPYPFQGGYVLITDVQASQTTFMTKISALDVRNGEIAWSSNFDDAFVPLIATGPDRVAILSVIFLQGADNSAATQTQIGVDVASGEQLWARNIDLNLDIHFVGQAAYGTSHRLAPDRGLSFVALDEVTGETIWSSEVPDSIRFLTRYDDLLIVGIQDFSQKSAPSPQWRLLAYDIPSASIVWTRLLQHNFTFELEWEVVDGAVIFAEGNTLNAVDIETGDVVWTYTAATVHPAGQISVGENTVVLTNFDEPVLFIEPPKFGP